MSEPLTLRTRIEPTGPAGAIVLTDKQVDALGGGRRAALRVTVAGRQARLRLAVMHGQNLIGLSKANRGLLGVEIGQDVVVTIELDTEPREVDLPADLAAALAADPMADAAYQGLAFTHRRESAEWVAAAVRPQTRARRVEQALSMLRDGRTRS